MTTASGGADAGVRPRLETRLEGAREGTEREKDEGLTERHKEAGDRLSSSRGSPERRKMAATVADEG